MRVMDLREIPEDAAHGGAKWSPRVETLQDEIGKIWGECGVNREWTSLRAVLMHQPGSEIESIDDADKILMLDVPDATIARAQHQSLVKAYQDIGVKVFYVRPGSVPPPNLMFVADLLFMTPEGAILARPASTIRAGEERFVGKRLLELGVPILRSIRGKGVFEGADAAWINPNLVIVGKGLRTNSDAVAQIASLLQEMDIEVIEANLPQNAMHLMGVLRFVDRDHAICWRKRTPETIIKVLGNHGFTVSFIPSENEAIYGLALNFVTLEPNRILMPADNPVTHSFYTDLGIQCITVEMNEIHKAAGGIGCLTGILNRE
jgi:N-dimethylarginine dimethylaminohydrolase